MQMHVALTDPVVPLRLRIDSERTLLVWRSFGALEPHRRHIALWTGRRAFEGETVNELMHQHLKIAPVSPKKIDPELSDGLCALIKKMIAKPPRKRYPTMREFVLDLQKVIGGQDPDALGEFGTMVKCGFCETFNPIGDKKCKVCGESLHAAGGPIEIVARPDEFKCPGCGGLNRRGSRVCGSCRKAFCARCKQRLAVLKGFCHHCMPHLRRR